MKRRIFPVVLLSVLVLVVMIYQVGFGQDSDQSQLFVKLMETSNKVVELEGRVDQLEKDLLIVKGYMLETAEEQSSKAKVAANQDTELKRPEFRYTYDLLVNTDKGKFTVNGKKGRYKIESVSEMGIECRWRNMHKFPARFTVFMELCEKKPTGLGRVTNQRIAGEAVVNIPLLQAGEVYSFTKWVRVDDARNVKMMRVSRVQAFRQ